MSWELAYAIFGAPLLLVAFALLMLGVTRAQERRERRLYDEHGWPRVQGGEGRR